MPRNTRIRWLLSASSADGAGRWGWGAIVCPRGLKFRAGGAIITSERKGKKERKKKGKRKKRRKRREGERGKEFKNKIS